MIKKIILLFLLLCGTANATTYYVDKAGDDLNNGSQAAPFATFQKAADSVLGPGDMVCVNDGEYIGEKYTLKHYSKSGTAEKPIVYKNCQGGNVYIDPSIHVKEWTSLGNNLWEAKTGTVNIYNILWKDTTKIRGSQACTALDLQDEWCVSPNSRIQVFSIADPSSFIWHIVRVFGTVRNSAYVVFDGFRIFYSNFSYQIGDNSDANSIPRGSVSYITVKNHEIAYTGTRGIRPIGSIKYPMSYIYIDNNHIHHTNAGNDQNGHCIKFDSNENGYFNHHLYVTGNLIHDCDLCGVQFSNTTQHAYASGNTIYNTSQKQNGIGAAIRCGDMYHCHIWGNTLYGGDRPFGSGIYLNETASPAYVYNNKISGYNFYGIFVGGMAKLPYNLHIFNNLVISNKLGAISISNGKDIYLYHNYFTDGVSIGGLAVGVILKNNLFKGGGTSPLISMYDKDTIIEENNLFFNEKYPTKVFKFEGIQYDLAGYKVLSGKGKGSVQVDPQLDVNRVPIEGSPTIDAGQPLAVDYEKDYVGTKRPQGVGWDIGPFEFPVISLPPEPEPEVITFEINKNVKQIIINVDR